MAKPLVASLLLLLALVSPSRSFSPDRPTYRHLLILVDDLATRSSHSLFFNSLRSRGYDLDFRLADDPKLVLQRYGQYLYDGLVLFAPSTKRFGGSLDLAGILEFVDSGHDLILAADSSASDLIRDIATECGVEFDEDPSAVVIDHTSYSVSDAEGDHTLIAGDDFIESEVILGEKRIEVLRFCTSFEFMNDIALGWPCLVGEYCIQIVERASLDPTVKAPVLFRGIGHSLNAVNSLALKVLSASPAAYSANPNEKLSKPPALTGSAISLVSVVQARNNARIVISGSLDLFSNRLFKSSVQKAGFPVRHEVCGNGQFATEISKWVFHERGHLKAVNVKHHKVGETVEPAMYRINDDLEYSVEIYEWTGTTWKPYVADDVQVQFYMMSPYILKTLSTNEMGLFSTSFKVPDVYGVFQFKVEYQRLGYTTLSLSKQIPVRPFRHNEYERFITAAYPYYGSAFSTMAGFFIFTIAYLYHK